MGLPLAGLETEENMSEKKCGPEPVHIASVSVDKDLQKNDRLIEFVRQIKNPYLFLAGKFDITAHFCENGPSFEDCLKRLIS